MQKSLIVSVAKEEQVKKQLQQSILRKRKVLEQWTEKVEMLRVELELIKNEYTVRIGYLFLKDNQLDLEIIQYKNLKRLMGEGMTYEQAVQAEEDTFYNEILRMQKEQEKIEEEKAFFESRQNVPEDVLQNLKAVWKKLIRRFHPDLVTEENEKQQRELLMKEINKAYAEGDLERLLQLENNADAQNIAETTREKLEQVLVQTENLIEQTKQTFTELRETEWYMWKKQMDKAKKAKQDVFAELEKQLLDDIVKKIAILKELRVAVNPQAVV